MNSLIRFYFLTLIVMSCGSDYEVKPMKYEKNGVSFNCDSYFKQDSLVKIYCFNSNRDTLLTEFYKNNLMHGMSTEFYDDGIIKKQGNYYYGNKIGTWFEYYADGLLKQRQRYVVNNDSFNIIYQKDYDALGKLYSLIYPIDKKMNKREYQPNDTVSFNLTLEYSEFDSVFIVAIINNVAIDKIDTMISKNNTINYEFIAKNKGEYLLKGILYEYNKAHGFSDDGYGGSREFTQPLVVK